MLQKIKEKLPRFSTLRGKEKAVKPKDTKKSKKKWKAIVATILVVSVLASVIVLPKVLRGSSNLPVIDLSNTTVLRYKDIEDSISAIGTVESAESTMVYSTLSYSVMAVYVELGDYVEEGQLLAQLDDQNIQDQISSQQVSMEASARSSGEQIKSAQANYDNYKYGLDNGLNSSLLSAQNQVESAYEAYEKAVLTYDRYRDGLDLGENTTLISAESSLRNAKSTMEGAQDTLDTAKESYYDACDSYEDAKDELNWAYDDLDDLEEKKESLQQELEQLHDELNNGANQLTELTNSWNSTNSEIENLQTQLDGLLAVAESERTESDQATIVNLNQRIAELTENLAEIERCIAQLEGVSSSGLEQKIAQLEQEIAAIQQQITQQETIISGLETAYEQAKSAVKNAESQWDSAQRSLDNAIASYDSQLASYNASVTSVDNTLADYAANVESTWESYQDALVSLASTEKSTKDQLQTYANSLSSAQTNANNATGEENLRQLRVDLESTQIKAPCSGTITAVYAQVGSGGSGLLFVIENVSNLVVDTSIKGYDVGKVQPGTKVAITSDATEDEKIEGVISSVAPTANKTNQGVTDTSADSVFAAEVKVTTQNTGLKIGMEAQLDYIIAEEKHILAAPYDAVYQNGQGKTCVIAAIEQSNGKYLLKEMPVTTGMDDDLDIVISGDDIVEGLRILNEPDNYMMMIGQTVSVGTVSTGIGSGGMGPMGMMGGGRAQ